MRRQPNRQWEDSRRSAPWSPRQVWMNRRIPTTKGNCHEHHRHHTARACRTLQERQEDRPHRRAHARRISGGPRRNRTERPTGSTRSGGADAGSQRLGQRAAVRHLSFGKPRPAGVREVPQGGLLERGQHRRRHDGLRGSWSSGRPWQEGHLAGAAGAHRSGIARAAGGGTRLVRPSGIHRAVGFRRSRSGVRRDHRYLRDGHDPGPNAVEPVSRNPLPAAPAELMPKKESRS